MKWSLILTLTLSLLVNAASATTTTTTSTSTTDEPETTTSRLHRSTFQEQLQWTTPLPTTESLPTDSDSGEATATTDSQVDAETESAPPAAMEALRQDSTEQQKPDMHEEEALEKVKTNPDNLPSTRPASDHHHPREGLVPSSLQQKQNEAEKANAAAAGEQVFVAHNASGFGGLVEDKQNSSEALQTKPRQTSSVDGASAADDGGVPTIVSVRVEDGKDPADSTATTATSFPPKENPAFDLKLSSPSTTAASAQQKPIIVDKEVSELPRSDSEIPTASETAPENPLEEREDPSKVTVTPMDGVSGTNSTTPDVDRRSDVSTEDDTQDPIDVSTSVPDEKPNATVVSATAGNHHSDLKPGRSFRKPLSILKKMLPTTTTTTPTSTQQEAKPETSTSASSQQQQETEQKLANVSDPTPLAEVTPEPQLNEVKLSLNASENEDSSSVEELPALSMMALKSPPLVEFSYKEGTPKPPSQSNIANIQKEPAKPIGEITDDDHVVEAHHSTADEGGDSEPPQPEGVLEIARKVTKMLEDKYTAEESRLHRRIGNASLPNLPIVIQRGTTPRPHRVEPHPAPDYDYHSIELMRLRAREHNNHRDLETEATGRNQELHPRTSKIMNAGATAASNKDKMIFIKTVPKGSLTTTEPSSTAVTSPSTVSSTSSTTTTSSTATSTTTDSNLAETETNSTLSSTTESSLAVDSQSNRGTSPPPKGVDDDYYDEPTEIVNEEDVVSSPEKPLLQELPRQPGIEPTKVIEDRPVMALVVQNPPNENSLTRKELKPLDTKDVQVSFILPAVSEPSVVPHKDKDPTSSKEVTEELFTEGIKSFTESSFDSRFPKPYPMQRVTTSTTERPTPAPADDRLDLAPTANPMSTLAGGESSSETGEYKLECPSKEDIHPCTCVTHEDDYDGTIETVATCRGIKHSATLIEALRGFRGHHLTYLIIDNSDLPPFPNNILHRIQVDWMEVLNTPVQFKREYLQCSIKCTLS